MKIIYIAFTFTFTFTLQGCSSIERGIARKLTSSYVAVHLSGEGANFFEEKTACIDTDCINYLYIKANSKQKNLEKTEHNQVSITINIDSQAYPISYNRFDEYQAFGEKYQGTVFIFPGFGAANSTMWLYGFWLSDSGFDVIILPSASQMTSFNFGLDTLPFAQELALEYKPVLTIGASLGFIAALEFSQQYTSKKLIGLAPVLDAAPEQLAGYFLQTNWLPWYLTWLNQSNLATQINQIAIETQTLDILNNHQSNVMKNLNTTLHINSSNDAVLDQINTPPSVTIDHSHQLVSSLPFESARYAIRNYFITHTTQH